MPAAPYEDHRIFPSQPTSGGGLRIVATVVDFTLLAVLAVLLPARWFLPADVLLVDIASAFTPQYAVLALVMALWSAWRRNGLRCIAFLLLLLPDLVTVAGYRSPGADVDRVLGRVYSANLGEDPGAVSRAIAELRELDADLIWLTEFPESLSPETEAELARLERDYPYGFARPASDGRSLHFLSRFPVRAREVFNPERAPGRPALRLTLDVRGVALTVFALHTHPPAASWSMTARNQTLAWVERSLAGLGGDALVVGDLNTSAFSPRFRALVRRGGLDCGSPWHCARPSWPAWLPLIATPIDHVLARGDVVVRDLRRGRRTGSDHFPIVAELGYRRVE